MVENNSPKRTGGATGKGFLPGRSGNPGGRPKGVEEVQRLAREHTGEAIKTLIGIARSQRAPAAARVAAAGVLLDRGWGKPVQSHELNHNLPVATAGDAALLAIALAGGGVAAASEAGEDGPAGVVH